jgi:hypothetical protein
LISSLLEAIGCEEIAKDEMDLEIRYSMLLELDSRFGWARGE